MQQTTTVQAHYESALATLCSKLEADYYVLAAALFGSVARGEAWEKSDIDLMIVIRDGKASRARPFIWLVEDGINIFAEVYPRSRLRQVLEGALQGSIVHSIRSHCKLLFSKDASITSWFEESAQIGARDQDFQLLQAAGGVFYPLEKAQKWLYAKHDMNYAFLWTLNTVNSLARVEVVLQGQAPGREALDQALQFNPDFFTRVYSDLIQGPKTGRTVHEALELIDGYLASRVDRLFKPVFDYLVEAQGPRTATEMDAYFRKKVQAQSLGMLYEWLVQHDFIDKLTSPVRLTHKSQVELEEAAYYYEMDDVSDWE
jgi:uncharacterized protein